jgi:hypothetical protein
MVCRHARPPTARRVTRRRHRQECVRTTTRSVAANRSFRIRRKVARSSCSCPKTKCTPIYPCSKKQQKLTRIRWVRITYIRDDGRATYPQQGKSSSLPLTPTVPHPTVPRLKNQRSLFSPDCLSNEFEQGEAFRGINKNAASRTMLLCSSPLLCHATSDPARHPVTATIRCPNHPPHRRQLTLPRLVKHTARAAYNQTKRLCPSSLPRFHLLLPVLCRETPLLRRDTHGGRDHAGGQCGRARAAPQGGETSVRGARAGVRECCADVASIFSGFLLKENRSCRSLGRRDSPSRF